MKKIAILGGTGALGAALARRLVKTGHEICIGSRNPAKAQATAREMTGESKDSHVFGAGLAEAASWGEIIFVTVPYAAHSETLTQIREPVQGKIVVDATVPLKPPKVGTVQLPAAGCAALDATEILGPKVRLVSALQNIGAEKLASGEPIDADVLIASDDSEAADTVLVIMTGLGIRGWHVGPLANSAAAEALTSVLIQLNRRYKLVQAGIRITGKAQDTT